MRFSFSRVLVVVVGCSGLLTACPEKMTAPVHGIGPAPVVDAGVPPRTDSGAAAAPSGGSDDAGAADSGSTGATGSTAAMGDAGAAAGAGPAASDPALDGNLQKFAGFSADESQYAFSVYSDGAGFYLVHIVEGRDGKVKERFILDSEESLETARKALKARGFSSREGTLAGGVRPTAKVEDGKVVVAVGGKVLYRGDPFGAREGGGSAQSAKVAQVSPSGRKVAVQVNQTPVTEFGGITTYLVLDAPAP